MADAQIAIIDGDQTQVVLAPGENPAIVSSIPGPQGPAGAGVPLGGTANQVLFKQSGTNYDTAWGPITSAMIGDLEIVNADVSASAAIAGTKISPNFGSQTIQTTGVFSHALGTAGAPTITFTGDTNTGLYSPGADQLALSTNGTGRLFIDANGNTTIRSDSTSITTPITLQNRGIDSAGDGVGISFNMAFLDGTVRNSGAIYSIAENNHSTVGTSLTSLVFAPASANVNIERLRIQSDGKVGIGTSAPSSILHLRETNPVLTLQSTNGTGNSHSLTSAGTNGESLFLISGGSLYARAASASGIFQVQTGGTTPRLTVDSSGRVGIGTQSPGVPLSVKTAGGDSAAIHVIARTAGSQSIVFRDSNDTANTAILYQDTNVLSLANVQNAPLSFATNNTERARITSSGQLLVGTASARSNFFNASVTSQLQVEGTTTTTSSISCVSNNASGNNPGIFLAKSNGAAVGSNTIVSNSDVLGGVYIQGSDGSEFVAAASITAEVDGTTGANTMPGRLVFSTTSSTPGASPTPRLTITSTGQVRLAGAGITFNGDTAAANELDDYEEGTFTPTLTSTNADTVVGSYQSRIGLYTKIGNLVTISIYLTTNVTTAGTGNVIVTGLPFTSGATSLSALSLSSIGRWTTQGPLAAGIGSNSTTINLEETESAVDPNLATPLSTSRLTTGGSFKNVMLLTGFYRV